MGYERVGYRDMYRFNSAIERHFGFRYPFLYLQNAIVYGFKKNDKYVAGFILKKYDKSFNSFRVLDQIPKSSNWKVLDCLSNTNAITAKNKHLFEYTGYFIADKSIGLYFTFRMILSVIWSGGKFFFYSYNSNNINLASYYAHGKPVRLYDGVVNYWIADASTRETMRQGYERVEMLSRYGVISIFVWRTWRIFKRWIKNFIRKYYPI